MHMHVHGNNKHSVVRLWGCSLQLSDAGIVAEELELCGLCIQMEKVVKGSCSWNLF